MAKNKQLYDNGLGEDKKIEVRVQKLVKAWQKRQEPVLQKRQKILALWASGFFDSGYQREHLINLMDRGVFTIVPFLVEGNPKVMVETLVNTYRSWAVTTQLALNFEIEKMNLAERVFIPAAINSMFGAGIVRTFTEYNRIVNIDNEQIKSGVPAIRVIDDVDYIGDVVARCREDYAFEGDIYKLPTEYARELFSKYADEISPDCKLTSEYHPDKIASGEWDINRLSLDEYTTFMDVYFYDENVTRTIMPYGKAAKFLNEVEEDGPGKSPYDFLGYKYFPGCTYPLPPAWFWHDQDVSMNIVARTARMQAESQKDLIFADKSNEDLPNKVIQGKNLDVMLVQDPQAGIQKVSVGGMNPDNLNWMNFVDILFNKSGGTPEIMRGVGSESPTLGQERMIFQNASRIVNNMHSRFESFMTSIIKKLAWKIWTDPTAWIPVVKEIPGLEKFPVVFSQADKVGDFYDFVFKIKPYSSQRMSPEDKYQRLMQLAQQWLIPTIPLSQEQGAELNIPETTERLASYLGFDDFSQLYRTVVPKPTDNVQYQMQPNTNKAPGQMPDTFGASLPSREANSQRQENQIFQTPELGVQQQ